MAQFADPRTPIGRFSAQVDPNSPPEKSMTEEAVDQIEHAAGTVVSTVKKYPVTTLAIAAGLAFAVGALWKAGRPRPSRWDALQAHLPDMPTAKQLKSYWR